MYTFVACVVRSSVRVQSVVHIQGTLVLSIVHIHPLYTHTHTQVLQLEELIDDERERISDPHALAWLRGHHMSYVSP